MKRDTTFAKRLLRGVAASLCVVSLLTLGGCAFSDTITQKIYEQNDTNEVDLETQKLLVNTIDAKQTSEELPQLVADDSSKDKQDTDQDLPRYGGDTSQALVAKPVPSSNNPQEQLSQPDKSTDSTATDEAGNPSEEDAKEGTDKSDGKGEEEGEKGDNPDAEGDKNTDTGSGKNSKNKVKVYKDYGEFAEIPEEITHVTAVGQAAVIVSMLGGTEEDTPLVGADADFVENEQIQKVLAKKSVDKVAKVWKNDGDNEGDLKSTKPIIDLDPELCFVMEGDDTFTEEQEQELLDKKIIVYEIPNMSSASKITYAVKLVGDILEKGGNKQAGELRDEYLEFHDDLVDKLKDKNDGITGGFNYDSSKKASTSATNLFTLLVTDWDEDAVYDDSNAFLASGSGVAISELGYETAPSAYYMSIGGVVNNAAAGSWKDLSKRTAAVWQFTTSKASVAWKRWTSIDREKVTYAPSPQGFDNALLWNKSSECGLGTKEFPAVIVSTQKQKELMETDAQQDNGIYHPYSLVSKGDYATYTSVGFYTGSNLVDACIGTHGMGSPSVLTDKEEDPKMYDIYVNPTGLFCNWTQGSIESVLESSWIYKKFRNDEYDASKDVEDFYKKFYDYELDEDELDAILDGAES